MSERIPFAAAVGLVGNKPVAISRLVIGALALAALCCSSCAPTRTSNAATAWHLMAIDATDAWNMTRGEKAVIAIEGNALDGVAMAGELLDHLGFGKMDHLDRPLPGARDGQRFVTPTFSTDGNADGAPGGGSQQQCDTRHRGQCDMAEPPSLAQHTFLP